MNIPEAGMKRRLATVVAMDVVGYSRLMEQDEVGTLEHLKRLRSAVVDPAAKRHSGRTVKLMGDGALLEFSTVVGAVQFAVDIQRELSAGHEAGGDKPKMQMRIGIHLGDVLVDGDDIYGDGVNVAARLESIAEPGGIVLSKQVYEQVGRNVRAQFVSLGEQSIKNISRPIHAFRVQLLPVVADTSVLRFDDFELDTSLFELRKSGERIPVEPQVLDLLIFLARNHDRIVTREELFAKIWGGRIVSDAALSSQIKAARRALGDDGTSQRFISTVHGRGFRFAKSVQGSGTKSVNAHGAIEVSAAVTVRPSVAVLPFVNQNRDPEEDYFADGVTEDIITSVSKHRWLAVVARNPAFAFRNSTEGVRTIGQKLNAQYLVTGSIRKAGARFRITVELVDSATERSVWSERFDREMRDVFELQDEISGLVAARIEAELGLEEQRKALKQTRKNLGAWDAYQLGSADFYKFTRESNYKAQELFRQSIVLDPQFGGAYSRLAYAIVLGMVYFGNEPERERLDEALALAKRAIELDDQDANSYFTIGRVHLARREYDLAIDALEYAIELNPSLAVSYCGLGDSLAYEGRLDEAIVQFETAINLSPHDPFRWAFYSYRSLAHLFRGDFDQAANWARSAARIPNAQYWARAHLVAALGHLGQREQAAAAVEELLKMKPDFSLAFAEKQLFYLKRPEQIATYIEGLRKSGLT
jgi:TolB-like protein/class 3 adenylate cyclase/Tfp pilus assembly protein PilF